MTTFFQCIDEHAEKGTISKKDAKDLKERWRRLMEARRDTAGAAADQLARQDLLDELEATARHKRRQAKLALDAARRIDADAASYRTAAGRADRGAAFLDMIEHFGTAPFSSAEGRRRAIVGMTHAKMENFLHHFRRGAILGERGRWHAAQLDNVLREAFGVDTGDAAAKGFATAWKDTHEWLRQRFNAAGGAIGKLENWGLPQHHDPRALRKAGKAAWKDYIRPLLDPGRMKHPLTGRAPDGRELDELLDGVFDEIATEGWINREPQQRAHGRGALAAQRAEHRLLVFRDPESWLAYQRDFGGGGDIFAAMMGHINGMAKDIAAMEVLGPNPGGMVEWMKQSLEKEAQTAAATSRTTGTRLEDRAKTQAKRLDAVWGSVSGALETPVSSRWANGLGAVRSLITASVLGQAAISSISDAGTSIIARRFAGLPAGNAITDIVKGFTTYSRREAVNAGLVLDEALHAFHAQARYVGTFGGPEWAKYLADRVLTYSGLTPWTQAAKHAFGLAFQVELGARAGDALEQLPAALANTLRRYGFTPAQWDRIRQVPLHDGRMLRPAEIARHIDETLAEKYLAMIQTETSYAVPDGSHRSRTLLLGDNQPGTLTGEILRSFAQFKSFGAVFVLLHGARMHGMLAGGSTVAGAAYAGSLLASTTLFGAAALQLKSIAGGRDPRDTTDPAFWSAAMLQGGGLGIYGDFLFANVNRYGSGFGSTVAGPTIERANDFWNLTGGNLVQLASGEKTHFGRELVKFMRGSIPGGNIWYLKLAWEREVLDQMQFLADPEANKAFKRQQQYWRRNYGQDYFWAPGERRPQRAPDIAAAFGGS